MALKRKTNNLSNMNDQMSFFDPVYSNEEENDLLADGIPRPTFIKGNQTESNETLDTDTITNNDQDQTSELISTSKIRIRIKQIQNSIQQAQTMLESMEKFQHLVPDTDEQREKLYSIISNLEEQHASYTNLLNLITLSEEQRSVIINRNSTYEENDDDQSSLRPRIESKIGLPSTKNSSDNEQTTRNDNSNYDSLVGSLKSDTIYWKDQQSTSADEESDIEIEKNLMLQKEQLRALQGQKRALLALKRRSEQQQLDNKKNMNRKQTNDENELLSDINSLRDRLKLLQTLYEQKYQDEIQQLKASIPTENRLKNLEHIRERLDELEQLITYYQNDLTNQQNEEIFIENNNTPKHLNQLSNELTSKRLELEQAKSALNQLQQMVKTIQPEKSPSSTCSSSKLKINDFQSSSKENHSVDVKMAAQHREIERLIESRQRLHTIKDQIASLHQSVTTPNDLINEIKTYEDKLNDSRNIRPTYREENFSQDDNQSELNHFQDENDDDDDDIVSYIQSPIKQSNLCVSVDKHSDDLPSQIREICRCLSTFIEEQKSFNRHIEQCLTTARNSSTTSSSISQSIDPIFNQFQQQILTQGLIVNLNTAYREIAVLQSEINALQSENNRLTSSISFDNQYHSQQQQQHIPRLYSRESSRELINNIRPKPRSKFSESNHLLINKPFNLQNTTIHLNKINIETTPNIQERNAKTSTEYLSSPKHMSDTYVLPKHSRDLSKENIPKSFANHQQLENKNDNNQESNDFSKTVIDTQTLDLQIKSIMIQIIPFMRLHINEIFNQTILKQISERILFLFKQQSDSADLIRNFQNQFSELLRKTIEKYCGTTIRECAADLIRDISDVVYDELIKYKNYQSESEILNRIVNNEDDQENELETGVSRHDYILVNHSISNNIEFSK